MKLGRKKKLFEVGSLFPYLYGALTAANKINIRLWTNTVGKVAALIVCGQLPQTALAFTWGVSISWLAMFVLFCFSVFFSFLCGVLSYCIVLHGLFDLARLDYSCVTFNFRGLSESGDVVSVDADQHHHHHQPEAAFDVPKEFASAIERLDGSQMKRTVELMGQCVQVHHVLVILRLSVTHGWLC